MSESSSPSPETIGTRSIDLTIEIRAAVADVWRAISDGEELTRWFPPVASVEPGAGGQVTVSWGGGSEWTSDIVAWEPGSHLRLEDRLPPEVADTGVVVALDYHLEDRGGSTVLRLVNSGFSADDDWDDYYHMLENGWTFFLWNLKHYLERHPGTSRTMMSVRPWVSGTRQDVWNTVFGPGGIGVAPSKAGAPFSFNVGDRRLEGTVVLSDAPWAFAGRVESLNDGVLHVEMEGSGDRWKMGVWLSAYGMDEELCRLFASALETAIEGLYPDQVTP